MIYCIIIKKRRTNMLKVYNITRYVSVDGGKWYKVGRIGEDMRDDSEPKTLFKFMSFNECCQYLQEHHLPGVYYKTTLFKKNFTTKP